jgi:glutamyl-tRNA reductase
LNQSPWFDYNRETILAEELNVMRVSFIGLGAIGYPMAGHLPKKFQTLVWNRTRARAQAHAKEHTSGWSRIVFGVTPTEYH